MKRSLARVSLAAQSLNAECILIKKTPNIKVTIIYYICDAYLIRVSRSYLEKTACITGDVKLILTEY